MKKSISSKEQSVPLEVRNSFSRAKSVSIGNKRPEKLWRLIDSKDSLDRAAICSVIMVKELIAQKFVVTNSSINKLKEFDRIDFKKSVIILNILSNFAKNILLLEKHFGEKIQSDNFKKMFSKMKTFASVSAADKEKEFDLSLLVSTSKKFVDGCCVLSQVLETNAKAKRDMYIPNGTHVGFFNESSLYSFLDEVVEQLRTESELREIKELEKLLNNQVATYMFFVNPKDLDLSDAGAIDAFISSAKCKESVCLSTNKGSSVEEVPSALNELDKDKDKESIIALKRNDNDCLKGSKLAVEPSTVVSSKLLESKSSKKIKSCLRTNEIKFKEKSLFVPSYRRTVDSVIAVPLFYLISLMGFVFDDQKLLTIAKTYAPNLDWQSYKLNNVDVFCINELLKSSDLENIFSSLNSASVNPILSSLGALSNGLNKDCTKRLLIAHQIQKIDEAFDNGLHLLLTPDVRQEMFLKFLIDGQLQVAQYLINKEHELFLDGAVQSIDIKSTLKSNLKLQDNSVIVGHAYWANRVPPVSIDKEQGIEQWCLYASANIEKKLQGNVAVIDSANLRVDSAIKRFAANISAALISNALTEEDQKENVDSKSEIKCASALKRKKML